MHMRIICVCSLKSPSGKTAESLCETYGVPADCINKQVDKVEKVEILSVEISKDIMQKSIESASFFYVFIRRIRSDGKSKVYLITETCRVHIKNITRALTCENKDNIHIILKRDTKNKRKETYIYIVYAGMTITAYTRCDCVRISAGL